MTIVKNRAQTLIVLMLLGSLAFSGSVAFAGNIAATKNDTKDVCDIETADDTEDVVDDNTSADNNDAEDVCEQAESVKLAKQVTISEAKARLIAERNHTTKAKITELILARDEDQNNVARVVYEIEFTETDGTQVDVKVDANTGAYLGVDTQDDNDGEDPTDDVVHVAVNKNTSDLQMKLISLLQQLIRLLKA